MVFNIKDYIPSALYEAIAKPTDHLTRDTIQLHQSVIKELKAHVERLNAERDDILGEIERDEEKIKEKRLKEKKVNELVSAVKAILSTLEASMPKPPAGNKENDGSITRDVSGIWRGEVGIREQAAKESNGASLKRKAALYEDVAPSSSTPRRNTSKKRRSDERRPSLEAKCGEDSSEVLDKGTFVLETGEAALDSDAFSNDGDD